MAIALLLTATPLAAADRSWSFRVFLDDREVGIHRFELRDTAGGQELRSNARFDVRFLGVPVYRYRHEAMERWRDDCLQSLYSQTDSNGKRQQVRSDFDQCVMSFAYWNPAILRARQLINSQTGALTDVTIDSLGAGAVGVRGKSQVAEHYRLIGPKLSMDLWYADGDWIGLDADTDGGHRLHYRLL